MRRAGSIFAKLFRYLRPASRKTRRDHDTLHRLVAPVVPPRTLFGRIENDLDRIARVRIRRLKAGTRTAALVIAATLGALFGMQTTDPPVILHDAGGQTLASLAVVNDTLMISAQIRNLPAATTAHLWGFDAKGSPVHITRLPDCAEKIPSGADGKHFAVSIEDQAFSAGDPPGLLLATSARRGFFSLRLHPKFVCDPSCCM